MFINTVLTRDDVVRLLESFGSPMEWALPLSQCDFVLDLRGGKSGGLSTNMVVTGFTIPEVGINFSQQPQYFGLYTPSFTSQPVSVEFLWSPNKGASAFHKEYQNQFNSKGMIDVQKLRILPNINLCAVYNGMTRILLMLEKCMFSNPVPTVNYKSAEFSPFRVNVFYRDIKYTDQ